MSTAYSYARISHVKQEDEDSLPGQIARAEGYYTLMLKDRGILWGGPEWDEFAISAFKRPFSTRPAGIRLLNKLQQGDHIIFDKVDRVWRRVDDFVDLMRMFNDRGITAHFVSFRGVSVETNTPMGNFMLHLTVAIAQLEAETTSARNREVNEYRRLTGKVSATAPYGWRIVGERTDRKDSRVMIEDGEEQLNMQLIYALRKSGKSFKEVADDMERGHCDALGVPCMLSEWKRTWRLTHCHKLFGRYQVILLWKEEVEGGFDPVRYKTRDGLDNVATILNQRGEEEARAEIRRMKEGYFSKSSVLIAGRNRLRQKG